MLLYRKLQIIFFFHLHFGCELLCHFGESMTAVLWGEKKVRKHQLKFLKGAKTNKEDGGDVGELLASHEAKPEHFHHPGPRPTLMLRTELLRTWDTSTVFLHQHGGNGDNSSSQVR